MCKQTKSAWCNVATPLKPVTNQLQDEPGSAGGGRGEEKKTRHCRRTCSVRLWRKGVWCCKECVCACREGGCLTALVFLHTLFVLYFLCHMTCIFFFFEPPPSRHVNVVLARQERQNSCGCTEQFPINRRIMQAGNSNKMQMSGGARLQSKHEKRLTGASGAARPGRPGPAVWLQVQPLLTTSATCLLQIASAK